jgi:hypothetical protein
MDMLDVLVTGVILMIASHQTVHAYLDPGSGSLLFQVLAASIIGLVYVFRKKWVNLISFFRQTANSSTKDDPQKVTKRK